MLQTKLIMAMVTWRVQCNSSGLDILSITGAVDAPRSYAFHSVTKLADSNHQGWQPDFACAVQQS